ncbi:MAG: hypothetical protein QOF18_387 [Frankiaceae bacterium]|nr:hypothetical protein [Frankiaceae bacterium]
MARASAKKTQTRRTSRKAAPARSRARSTAASRPAKKTTAAAPAAAASAPAAGSIDLAGGLRRLLSSVEAEVRAVGALSERIDTLVAELNERRDEQAKRLLTLDALRSSVNDVSLGAFLDKAIRPRKVRVVEVMPKRLTQG